MRVGIFRYLKINQGIRATLPEPIVKSMDNMAKKSLESSRFYRYGLMRDDMILEEHDVVQEALRRIPKHELHGRYQRFKVALHTSMLRQELPKDKWMSLKEDRKYLSPFVEQVLLECEEREKYDHGSFERS